MELQNRYKLLKELVTTRRAEFRQLMSFIEAKTSYLTAPASTRFHLCQEHGLLEHSVNVAETLLELKRTLAPSISDESCVIVALLHDLGKAGLPDEPQYLVNHSESAAWRPYNFNTQLLYLSVPVRSLYLIGPLFPLTPEEAQAIIYHDGQYVEDNRSVATKEAPLTLLLQYADNWCGFVKEKRGA